MNLHIREKFAKCYEYFVLLYGCETWSLDTNSVHKIEAFEMWLFRKILKIPLTSKTRQEEIIRRGHQALCQIPSRKIFDSCYQQTITRSPKPRAKYPYGKHGSRPRPKGHNTLRRRSQIDRSLPQTPSYYF